MGGDHNFEGVPGGLLNGLPGLLASLFDALSVSFIPVFPAIVEVEAAAALSILLINFALYMRECWRMRENLAHAVTQFWCGNHFLYFLSNSGHFRQ